MKKYQTIMMVIIMECFLLYPVLNSRSDTNKDELIRLLNSKKYEDREKAKKELIALGEEVVPILNEYLDKAKGNVRNELVRVLAAIMTDEATNILAKIAVNRQEEETTRINAIQGLKNRQLKPDTIIILLNDEKFIIRYHTLLQDLIKEDTTDSSLITTIKEKLLTEKHWQIKGWIATKFSKLICVKPETKIEYLLKILEEECKNPIIVNEEDGEGISSQPITCHRYIYDFVNIGPPAIPLLKEKMKKEATEIKEIIIVILSLLKDTEMFIPLIDILKNSKDGQTRSFAARALGEIGDKKAIDELKKALNDNYSVKGVPSDLKFPPGYEYMEIYYPVRQEAFFALAKLGVKVKQKGTGPNDYHEYIIEEDKEKQEQKSADPKNPPGDKQDKK